MLTEVLRALTTASHKRLTLTRQLRHRMAAEVVKGFRDTGRYFRCWKESRDSGRTHSINFHKDRQIERRVTAAVLTDVLRVQAIARQNRRH